MGDKGKIESKVDEAVEESFPASDPPSWTLGPETARSPVRRRSVAARARGAELWRRVSADPFSALLAGAVAIAAIPPLRRAVVRFALPAALGYATYRRLRGGPIVRG